MESEVDSIELSFEVIIEAKSMYKCLNFLLVDVERWNSLQ